MTLLTDFPTFEFEVPNVTVDADNFLPLRHESTRPPGFRQSGEGGGGCGGGGGGEGGVEINSHGQE